MTHAELQEMIDEDLSAYNQNNPFAYKITERKSDNVYNCQVKSILKDEEKVTNDNLFIKFSPLMDPIKYITGKYKMRDDVFNLPKNCKYFWFTFKF